MNNVSGSPKRPKGLVFRLGAQRRPFGCPVCGGRGHVSNGFYSSVGVNCWSSNSLAPETCRSCGGGGIVWEPANEKEG